MNIVNREQKQFRLVFLDTKVNEQMNEWTNEWMNEWVNEWMNEWTFIHSSYFLNGANFKPFCYFLIAVTYI